MRRKQEQLIPIEKQILKSARKLKQQGQDEFYGYFIARTMADEKHSKILIGYGTLYRALNRLVKFGYLTSRWEDYFANLSESRPRRRYYKLTQKSI